MSVQQLLFIIFGALTVGAAVAVVTVRRVFHAALWMAGAFFGVAAIYMLLESPFFAGVQFFVYIGGISILAVIAIMVTKGMMTRERPFSNDPLTSLVMAVAFFGATVWMILQFPWPETPVLVAPDPQGLAHLGMALVDPNAYLMPFEVVSVMLVVVLIGSLYLGRER